MIRISHVGRILALALMPLLPIMALGQSATGQSTPGSPTQINQGQTNQDAPPIASPPGVILPGTPPSIANPAPVPTVSTPALNVPGASVPGASVPGTNVAPVQAPLTPPTSSFPATPSSIASPTSPSVGQPASAPSNRTVIRDGVIAPVGEQTTPRSTLQPGVTSVRISPDDAAPNNSAAPQSGQSRLQTTGFTRTAIADQLASGAAARLDAQLLQATCAQNWQGAIAIVDQALTSAPTNQAYRSQLREYRGRLQSLAVAGAAIPDWSQRCTGR
jgi:hypothetical protein